MTWFETLTGISEGCADQVRNQLAMDGDMLISRANGQRWTAGRLETPSLGELRRRVNELALAPRRMVVKEVIADAKALHADRGNAGALFQVASQFNLLEMAGPELRPEDGVGIYEHDATQGPACAVAAGAGTIYRNYLVPVGGQLGQSEHCQIDCLADLGQMLGNHAGRLWVMRNGYVEATRDGLADIARRLQSTDQSDRDQLRSTLRIGLQWNTQVTLPGCSHTLTQAYCSALPVAYSHLPASDWEPFARLILEAAYESVLCAGLINMQATGNPVVYLTLIGGGVFGNERSWIVDSLVRAIDLLSDAPLDLRIVSFRRAQPEVQAILEGVR